MKTKSFLGTVTFMVLSLVSCVKSEYDDHNRNNEINVLPGMSVSVNKNLSDITPASLFGVYGNAVDMDSKGNYTIFGVSRNGGFEESIQSVSFDAGEMAEFNSGIEIEFKDVPEFLSKDSFYGSLAAPSLRIYVDNQTGSGALLSFSAQAGSRNMMISGVAVPQGKQVITVENDDLKNLFEDGVPSKINISDMKLSKAACDTKSVNAFNGGDQGSYSVAVDAGCVIPMSFDAYSVAIFDYLVDFNKESLSINSLEGIKVGVKEIEFTGTIWNEIPLSVKLQAVGLDSNQNVFTKDVSFRYSDENGKPVSGVQAGAPGKSVATNFTVLIKSDSDLVNMSNIKAVIEATNATNEAVSLNESQRIKFHINDATFGEGVSVN